MIATLKGFAASVYLINWGVLESVTRMLSIIVPQTKWPCSDISPHWHCTMMSYQDRKYCNVGRLIHVMSFRLNRSLERQGTICKAQASNPRPREPISRTHRVSFPIWQDAIGAS